MPLTPGPVPPAQALLRAAHQILSDAGSSLGLAVSGGGDSMAMLHVMAEVAPKGVLRVVTVDHGLRPEAAQEVRFVSEVCRELNLPHDGLIWDHGVIAGNVMDQARRARLALIANWARERGVVHVALAHTATDQAETFLMGLARQAGLDGLSGMRASFCHDGVVFLRPLLAQSRGALRAYLTQKGATWVEDPTNEDLDYTRTKARKILKYLAPIGISEAGLAKTVGHLAKAQAALRHATAEAAASALTESAGALIGHRTSFVALGPELGRRVLIAAVMWLSGADYAPRAAMTERLLAAVSEGRDATLWGCRVKTTGEGFVILREAKALGPAVRLGQIWDGRWQLSGPNPLGPNPLRPDAFGAKIQALGAQGLAACKDWRNTTIPREVLLVSPGLWRGDALIAAPFAENSSIWWAKVSQSFNESILSH